VEASNAGGIGEIDFRPISLHRVSRVDELTWWAVVICLLLLKLFLVCQVKSDFDETFHDMSLRARGYKVAQQICINCASLVSFQFYKIFASSGVFIGVWLAHPSLTTACHTCCMRNCTGLTSQNISTYKLGVTVHCCLLNEYLVDCCTPVLNIPSRRHLRSATRHHVTIPRYWLSTFGHRAFSVAGLELATRQSPWPGAQQQQLQTIAKQAFIDVVAKMPK